MQAHVSEWACQFFLVPSRSSNTPLYPSKCCELGSGSKFQLLPHCRILGPSSGSTRNLGVRQMINYSFFIFCANFQTKKRLIVTCVFECLKLCCHILKKLREFLCTMSALTIFLVNIVSYLILWLMDWWQNQLGLGAHLKRWGEKNQISKDAFESFHNQIKMNHLT
jgi:hypothetical protein